MFSGWGWNGLGIPLHDILPIIQIAEIYRCGRAFFCCGVCQRDRRRNGAAVHHREQGAGDAGRITISPLPWRRSSAFAVTGSGSCKCQWRGNRSELQRYRPTCRANEKFSRALPGENVCPIRPTERLALATRPPPQLIVWPESSTPAPALLDEENYRFVMDLSASIKTDLLLGTIDQDQTGDYNAALLVSERGREHSALS